MLFQWSNPLYSENFMEKKKTFLKVDKRGNEAFPYVPDNQMRAECNVCSKEAYSE